MKKTRLNRKGKQVVMALCIIMIMILMLIIFVGIKLYQKYSPSKERMAYQDYFEMQNEDEVLVYMNDEILKINDEKLNVLYEDGKCYLPQDYVETNLNCRFYYDKVTDGIIFSVPDDMYYFTADATAYTTMNGQSAQTEYVVVRRVNDEFYIALDYIKEHTDINYRFYENPKRLFMWTEYLEKTYALLLKDTPIRFRGGIKSPIIADGLENQEVEVLQDLEDWIEVRTEDGYLGYVTAKAVDDTFSRTEASTFVDVEAPQATTFNGKINLVFQAIGSAAYGEAVKEAMASTSGVNVVSPTWYKLSGGEGDLSSYANADYVRACHSMNMQVWALVDDFDVTPEERLAVLSDKNARGRVINKLISEAASYGFDGINLDFENINSDTATHYLQFVRELSFVCRQNGIILSIDNYVPKEYNSHYNRKEQAFWIDYFIIMGYDEHWKGSQEAGPVASIGFVEEGIVKTLEEVPADKVINAMPYYVRVWTETKNTDGTISMSTRDLGMEAAKEQLDRNNVPIVWDETTALYYGSYEDGNTTVKIWLETEHSIEEKMKLYKNYGIAGVAGWRLGLEKKAVWSVIASYLN